MKLDRRTIIEIHNIIEGLSEKVVSPKLAFQLIKAKQAIANEINALAEAQKKLAITPEIEAYNAEQKALDTSDPEYAEKSKAIYEAHKELVDGFRKLDAEFGEMLKGEVDVEFDKIDISLLPEDVLTVKEIETLMPLFKD